ncbi:unnamed protein product [Ostreobium quekettii]|uniref:DUF8204 domain-containing protein n=1 Tax=Ostreobium quekettii TaxID=121088 RepID=A0A8S1J2I6_9CHLO|nr:unnamed protein product [Ostreobium quekettii]
MGKQAPQGPSQRRQKCCMGALYYSQALMDGRKEPVCAGFRRTHKAGEGAAEPQAEASNLSDFKYMCVGYSVYDEQRIRQQPSRHDATGGSVDLPYCEGLEIVSSRHLQGGPVLLKEGIDGQNPTQEQSAEGKNRGAPSFVSTPRGVSWEKFPERRCSRMQTTLQPP